MVCADGRAFTYGALQGDGDRFAESISARHKTLGFILCRNTPECLVAYLGALRGGHAVCLLDAELDPELLSHLLDIYAPDWIFTTEIRDIADYASHQVDQGFLLRRNSGEPATELEPELAVLLPTSGSTGSPKLVRLAFRNLQANACSIVQYLGITDADRAITSLPMAYSYGLSVLHSHLLAGGRLLMTTGSFLQREFWDFFSQQQPTSLAGVPYHYETMLRMRMLDKQLPGLQTLTQAGGRLAPDRIAEVQKISLHRGRRFFVMYGQTEATARISYVPPERLNEKIGSIGVAIPEGQLSLDPCTEELLYSGPNVMLGYAENRSDLAKGDEMKGMLRTGDKARQDDEGYYYIVGRLKRFLKIFGKRFSLDEMETLIGQHVGTAVACFGSDDNVHIAVERSTNGQAVATVVKDMLKIHPSAFRIVRVDTIPRLPNGKLDYQSLARLQEP